MARLLRLWEVLVILTLVLFVVSASAATSELSTRASTPEPVVFEASQQWEGNDGPWSSFVLQVGTPAQQVRVFISIGGQETWVVLPEGCPASAPNVNECPDLRGSLFLTNASTTWESTASIWNNTGLYALGGLVVEALGISGNGEYGFDTVSTSFNGGDGVTLNHTIVAGIATPDFYLGQFGVSPRPTNFTVENGNSSSLNDPQPSFFSLLKSNNIIPSLTYSFTAGSYSRSKSVKNALGSMIFGGYDTSLNGSSSATFNFAENAGRELVVAVQSITKSGDGASTDLLPNGILAVLDSSQPNIWLPLEACTQFENAFGLSWNATSELYMLNSTLHDSLVAENANITFRLGNTVSGGATVDIVFPYGAFDLTASWPLSSDSQPYFPLKRAANATQYTLGRTFFQEAYLIADYENSNFSLSQRNWDDNAEQNIVPIRLANATSTSSDPTSDSKGSALSTGAIVGIVVGAVALLCILTVALCIRRRRRRRNSASTERLDDVDGELDTGNETKYHAVELPSDGSQLVELEPERDRKVELVGDHEHVVEIDGVQRAAEMDGSGTRREVYELPGSQ
ncbi:Acid protease [Neofusicoccum parvum]|uniref:Acid protease n=1 Tax=Neofusicoccum parvum TaxID=310453 RepID=A0ACB5SIG1_9PEZI|nr:Acid protease [Neofusicoccum parvum]